MKKRATDNFEPIDECLECIHNGTDKCKNCRYAHLINPSSYLYKNISKKLKQISSKNKQNDN